MTEFFPEGFLLFFEFHSLQARTRAAAEGSLASQDDLLQLFRPAAGRHTQDTRKHLDNRIGEGDVVFFVKLENVSRLHLLGHQEKSHVADDFARWRDFHDVPEEPVHLGVHLFGVAPTMTEAHGGSLLTQVGVLAAGNFMLVQTRRAGLRTGVERKIVSADGFPVVGALVERVDVELRVARSVTERFDDGIEIGLAGASAHGGDGSIGDVDSGIGRFQHGGRVDAAGVVRMKVDRNANFLTQRLHQFECRVWFAQTSHIFNR